MTTTTKRTRKPSRKSSKPKRTQDDIFQAVTDRIIASLEKGVDGTWRQPWHGANFALPSNVESKKTYRGVNTIMLWVEAIEKGYDLPLWGTYRQWHNSVRHDCALARGERYCAEGPNVRKGEKATSVLFWKPWEHPDKNDPDKTVKGLVAREYAVFNVAQVDGYPLPANDKPVLDEAERIAHADEFFTAVGAKVTHIGGSAYYTPAADKINVPPFEDFRSGLDYYATLGHEHIHWTGHENRCNRQLQNRFGDDAYAVEELVAELGAAFLCATLGLTNEPREDHVQYLDHWLKVLKADPKAIITASSKAQQAVDFLDKAASPEVTEVTEVTEPEVAA